ncbi:MAG: hypothetical protein AAF380_02910 [Bacteroidota bacterium]
MKSTKFISAGLISSVSSLMASQSEGEPGASAGFLSSFGAWHWVGIGAVVLAAIAGGVYYYRSRNN